MRRSMLGAAVTAILVVALLPATALPAAAAGEADDLAAYDLHLEGQAERADDLATDPTAGAGAIGSESLRASAAVAALDFTPGNLISDANFRNANAMTEAEIQSFLESKVACQADTCLARYRVDTQNVTWTYGTCANYVGAPAERASRIIFKVQQACGLSARVILVTLQKEQSLVTDPAPSASTLMRAMGYACPDTASCDPSYAGFFMQVAAAARQLTWYGNAGGSFTWLKVGQANPITFHPDAARCGSSSVVLANAATAALYYYTPYQPNAAALANLYGTGDSCSAYGNRNFWRLHRDWFGDPRMGSTYTVARQEGIDRYATAAAVSKAAYPTAGVPVAYVASGADFADALSAAPAAATQGGPLLLTSPTAVPRQTLDELRRLDPGRIVIVGGTGAISTGVQNVLDDLAPVTRLGGANRYETSRNIVSYAFPSASAAYLATGRGFADGLSAGAAAGARKLPVLLVDGTAASADSSTLTALRTLRATEVRIAGGTGAVSAGIASSLTGAAFTVRRYAGEDRYGTSIALNRAAFPTAAGAYLATGTAFPDALTGAAAAGAKGRPLYLAPGTCVPVGLRVAVLGQGARSSTLLGGSAVVADAVGRLTAC